MRQMFENDYVRNDFFIGVAAFSALAMSAVAATIAVKNRTDLRLVTQATLTLVAKSDPSN